MKKQVLLICSMCILSLFTSCYRMPTDDDFSVVPTTNNPAVTHEKQGLFLPNMMGG